MRIQGVDLDDKTLLGAYCPGLQRKQNFKKYSKNLEREVN
jgi:hypothetical protein